MVLLALFVAAACVLATSDNLSTEEVVISDGSRGDIGSSGDADNVMRRVRVESLHAAASRAFKLENDGEELESDEFTQLPSDFFDDAIETPAVRGGDAGETGRTYVYNKETDSAYDIYHASSMGSLASKLTYHVGEAARRLAGSNCLEIERGTVTKYYMCVGCVVENAMGCIDDMRRNKSSNVIAGCKFHYAMEADMTHSMEQEQALKCCPKLNSVDGMLKYKGSAYPEALRCIADAGCEESVIYTQLLDECHGLCDYVPPDASDAQISRLRYGDDERRLDGMEDGEAAAAATDYDYEIEAWKQGRSWEHRNLAEVPESSICFSQFAAAPNGYVFTRALGVVLTAVLTSAFLL